MATSGLSAQAGYRDAERWFNSLDFNDRAAIQLALIWVGAYNGLVDGELGRRTHNSIRAYQQSIGAAPTGMLSSSEMDGLMARAGRLMDDLGFDFVSDRATGLKLALPLALVTSSGPTRRGFRWSSPDGSIEVETVSIPLAEQTYLELFQRFSRERGNRRVAYNTFKPSFFVVSGYTGTRKFYSRFAPGPTATRGFSVAWEPTLFPVMDRVAMAMSSLMTPDSGVSEPIEQRPTPNESARSQPEEPSTDDLFQGTGFFVSEAGHLVTNEHIVERCRSAAIRLADGRVSSAEILARSSQEDLAILKAEMAPSAVARFRVGKPVRLGEGVVVYGFPLAGSLGTTGGVLTVGHVSALAGPGDHAGILQMSAAVQSGNSGGPLVDQSGNVIGVVTWKSGMRLAEGKIEVLQNMNFAVKSSIVTNLLEAHGVPYMTAPSDSEKPNTEIADAARQYTAMVICR